MKKRLANLARKLTGSESRRNPTPEGQAVKLRLPTVAARDVIDGSVPITLLEPEFVLGNVTLLELALINTLVAARKPRNLFEIGTFDGRTTVNMIANAAPGARLHTLDLPKAAIGATAFSLHEAETSYVDKEVSGARFERSRWRTQVSQVFGDSATFDFSSYHGQMDVVFIDGSHQYEYVSNDTDVALKLVSNGGLILWHDYQPFWPGVITRLEELHRSGGVYAGLRNVEGSSLVFLEVRRQPDPFAP